MYPNNPEMDFECACPIVQRKNVWNDITGIHVRYCPICGERRDQVYEPTLTWEDSGRGLAGEFMPDYLQKQKDAADAKRAVRVAQ